MKDMNGLVMTLEEDKRFLCVWLLYWGSIMWAILPIRQKVPRYRSSSTSWDLIFFLLTVFSSSEVLAKIASPRSKLLTAACWSWEKKRGNCEANLLYVKSDFGNTNTTDKSFTVFFTRWGAKFDHWVTVWCVVEAKEKLTIILFCGFWFPRFNAIWYDLWCHIAWRIKYNWNVSFSLLLVTFSIKATF